MLGAQRLQLQACMGACPARPGLSQGLEPQTRSQRPLMQAQRPQPPLSHPPLRGGGVHEIEISPLRPIGVTGDASACADHAHAPLGQMLIDLYRS